MCAVISDCNGQKNVKIGQQKPKILQQEKLSYRWQTAQHVQRSVKVTIHGSILLAMVSC